MPLAMTHESSHCILVFDFVGSREAAHLPILHIFTDGSKNNLWSPGEIDNNHINPGLLPRIKPNPIQSCILGCQPSNPVCRYRSKWYQDNQYHAFIFLSRLPETRDTIYPRFYSRFSQCSLEDAIHSANYVYCHCKDWLGILSGYPVRWTLPVSMGVHSSEPRAY